MNRDIFIITFWYCFYFNLMGYIEFQFLIRFHINFYVYRSKFIIMYAVSFIYLNLSPHCFPFSSSQGKFSLPPRTMEFITVITVDDCLFHVVYRFPHRPRVWPIVWIAVTAGNATPSLCIFTIWRLSGSQRSLWRTPRTRMQNGPPFIINCLYPGGGSQGRVFHKCSNKYTPPPTPPPDWGC